MVLAATPGEATQFCHRDGKFWIARLCGMITGKQGEDAGPARTQGVALVNADGRRCEGSDLVLEGVEESDGTVVCRWRVGDTPLRLAVRWQECPDTGVVSRRDTLTNTGAAEVAVTRCLARVSFPPGRYECYTQASRWAKENQGAWQPLHAGIALRHAWGRTTEESTPYLAMRAIGAHQGVVFHVLPCGNWTIRVSPVTAGGELPYAVVELGLADENLHRVLQPGEALDLPETLFQPLPQGEPHLAAPALHRYLLAHHLNGAKAQAPVVYNTWFDQFDTLDVLRLRTQLAVAKALGCEVFVIDAGWYGAGGPNWSAQVGDWREKTEAAFRGKMHGFAEEVRAAGLGFGLWMEPERFGPDAPIRNEHPEWFVPVGDMARIDLTQPKAYAYLRSEIGRLVENYGLAWMKIDFNFSLDADASGTELADYTATWYRLLDEIREAYPQTFFEGCSSGAMRGDLAMLCHVDGHFLSDTVNPTDMLRISQGAWLRLPPGRLARWTVLRSAGKDLLPQRKGVAAPEAILSPGWTGWELAEVVDLDFALLAAMPGMMGLSGDLAGLGEASRTRIAEGIAFFKHWRRFIAGAVAHLLTPPEPLTSREGWIGVQLQTPGDDTSLVFLYRLGSAGAPPQLRLYALQPEATYAVTRGFDARATGAPLRGQALMTEGLPVAGLIGGLGCPAEIFVVRRTV
ncbi:MAG TPA: glycoside hydrolase family 36 protein [Phycisphaerae bacterium]|nr:glycoside hydrolase family 36 protein [Phycisphaerae bacterium]